MLTGDNEHTARAIAAQAGTDDMRAGLLPEEELSAVSGLSAQHGFAGMAGDGINDAPALALGIKAVFLVLAFAGLATMWMAVFADMGASLIVVFNGLRVLRGGGGDPDAGNGSDRPRPSSCAIAARSTCRSRT